MIQSMEILQLPIMALQERIEQELSENPVLEDAREAAPAATFSRLHRLSSLLNVVVMLAGIGAVVMEAVRAR